MKLFPLPDLRRGGALVCRLTVSQNTLRLCDLFISRLRRGNTAYIVPCGQGLTLLLNAFQTRRIGEVIERFWPSRSGEGRLDAFLYPLGLSSPFLHRDFVACYAASERGEVYTAEAQP